MRQKNFIVALIFSCALVLVYLYFPSLVSQKTFAPEDTQKSQENSSNSSESSVSNPEFQPQISIFFKEEFGKSSLEQISSEKLELSKPKKPTSYSKVHTTINPEDSLKIQEMKKILETKQIDFTSLDMPFVEVFQVFGSLIGIPIIIESEIADDLDQLDQVLSVDFRDGQVNKILVLTDKVRMISK